MYVYLLAGPKSILPRKCHLNIVVVYASDIDSSRIKLILSYTPSLNFLTELTRSDGASQCFFFSHHRQY